MIRSLRRSKDSPTCLVFGLLRETLYPDNFFCHPCKQYEDQFTSGSLHGLAKHDSKRHKCKANHFHWCFPTQLKEPDLFDGNIGAPVITPLGNDANDLSVAEDTELEVVSAAEESELLLDF
jgi:hypothetical protein